MFPTLILKKTDGMNLSILVTDCHNLPLLTQKSSDDIAKYIEEIELKKNSRRTNKKK